MRRLKFIHPQLNVGMLQTIRFGWMLFKDRILIFMADQPKPTFLYAGYLYELVFPGDNVIDRYHIAIGSSFNNFEPHIYK